MYSYAMLLERTVWEQDLSPLRLYSPISYDGQKFRRCYRRFLKDLGEKVTLEIIDS